MRTHFNEGRKREEYAGELRNAARHKRGLTNWRGGRGRNGLVSFEAWHVTNEDSLAGGKEEGGVVMDGPGLKARAWPGPALESPSRARPKPHSGHYLGPGLIF